MEAAQAFVAEATADGRLVYLSAVARPAQPGLEQALTGLLHELARRSYSELHGDRVRFDALQALKSMGFAVEDVEIAVSYRCPQCGASIQLNPEAVVYVCPYCGWAGSVTGESVAIRAWPAGHRGLVEGLARRLGGALVSAELRYAPLWVAEASAAAEAVARVTCRAGKAERTVRQSVRVGGRYTRALLARLHAEVLGGSELERWAERAWRRAEPKALSPEEAKPIAPSTLAPEISAEAAAEAARDAIEDELAEAAKKEAERLAERGGAGTAVRVELESFRASVEIERLELAFAPLWLFTYRRGLGLYSGAAVGPSCEPLAAEVRISNLERAARLAASWLAAVGGAGLVELALRESGRDPRALLAGFGGVALAVFVASTAFKPAKVRRA